MNIKWKSKKAGGLTREEIEYFDSQEKPDMFKDAKFGDRFITRGGDIAIYHRYSGPIIDQHLLITKDGEIYCRPDGTEIGYRMSVSDVVSRYKEHKEIDEKYISGVWRYLNEDGYMESWEKCDIFLEGMRQGYRRKVEEDNKE